MNNRQPSNREYATDFSDEINDKMHQSIYTRPRQVQTTPVFSNPVSTRSIDSRRHQTQSEPFSMGMGHQYQQIQNTRGPMLSFYPKQSRQESKTQFNRQRGWEIHKEASGYPNVKQHFERQYRQPQYPNQYPNEVHPWPHINLWVALNKMAAML